ncbi:hypothetical protein NDU88_003413 [Pleurodeles waltl]|uniref:Uncharacterized protein n=1 Tax=Pleurodeles waltl TaxID=8319 RepID=A0AAV7UYD1_PLEWA|nr:hypothetical protein NDU88_003413 [Pleurodeles waltl]
MLSRREARGASAADQAEAGGRPWAEDRKCYTVPGEEEQFHNYQGSEHLMQQLFLLQSEPEHGLVRLGHEYDYEKDCL